MNLSKHYFRFLVCGLVLACLVWPLALTNSVPVSAQTLGTQIFTDNFENGFEWTAQATPLEWGRSANRAYNGNYSAYCLGSMAGATSYLNYMDTTMYRDIDVSGCASATVDFVYWLEVENEYDYLFYAGFYDGTDWHWDYSTDSNTDWNTQTGISIPSNATRLGFRFESDVSNTYEGAYVDDVVLKCGNTVKFSDGFENGFAWTVESTPEVDHFWGLSTNRSNSPDHSAYCNGSDSGATKYVTYMDTIMYRDLPAGQFGLFILDFSYWLQVNQEYDSLYAGYLDENGWNWSSCLSSSTNEWRTITGISIPGSASLMAFRFVSGNSSPYEGAYIDDVSVTGGCGSLSTVLTDNFENGFNWTVPEVYQWDRSANRAFSGDYSAHCVGSVPGARNYVNDMDTIMYRDIDLSGCASAELDFTYWLEVEDGCDYLFYAGYYDGTDWHWDYSTSGNTDWNTQTDFSIPGNATRLGFRFTSDTSATYEGAYIDDVVLKCGDTVKFSDGFENGFTWSVESTPIDHFWGLSTNRSYSPDHSAYCNGSDSGASEYVDSMETLMYRDIDLSQFTSGVVSFRYWLRTESGYDYLFYAGYCDQNGWHWNYRTDMDTTDWTAVSGVNVPPTATRIGFRFVSDGSNTYEGAYIDDVRIQGFTITPCETAPIVGGEVTDVNKLLIAAPWISLILIVIGGGLWLTRRSPTFLK